MSREEEALLVTKQRRKYSNKYSSLENGRKIEILTADASRGMKVYVGYIEPNGQSDGPSVHKGEEFVFIIKGELQYSVGNDIYQLKEGDMLYYTSSLPHGYCNKSTEVAEVLWGETICGGGTHADSLP